MSKELEIPTGWKLFDRKEKNWKSYKHFFNRYIHKESKSGIIYFSTEKDGTILYIVEGYGIGTIDPDTFEEITDSAPIQRFELEKEKDAEKTLHNLMKENINYWIENNLDNK